MGVVGAALRGFGKALSKKSGTIKSIPIAKNLTKRRADFEDIVKHVDKYTSSKSPKIKHDAAKKVSKIHDKYEKLVSDTHKANKRLLRNTIGAGAAAITGVVSAHVGAKHKFPKYKKMMESDIIIKDGKLGLKPKKKN